MEEIFRANSINATLLAGGLLFVLTIVSILIKQKSEIVSLLLFWSIVVVVVANTLFLAASTFVLNSKSVTGGPVHWHADYEIWNCGKKLDIVDPTGWSNKVGTPTFHEHNDGRIHVEGVITDYNEITLGRFFEVIGGNITGNGIVAPLSDGVFSRVSGETCDNGETAALQVFVYSTESKENGLSYSQKKLTTPESYVPSGYSQVPPGDCIIIEYDRPKEKTDKLCNFYKVEKQKGKIKESTLRPDGLKVALLKGEIHGD